MPIFNLKEYLLWFRSQIHVPPQSWGCCIRGISGYISCIGVYVLSHQFARISNMLYMSIYIYVCVYEVKPRIRHKSVSSPECCCTYTIAVVIWTMRYKLRSVQKIRTWYPRSMWVCQESGLRLKDRSPSVPDKPGRGFGYMSRYSVQILICFIAYIFHLSSAGWVGNLAFQDRHSALCHCPLSSERGCSLDNQIYQHALHGPRCSRMNGLPGIYATELVKLTNAMDAIHINGEGFYQDFFISVTNFAAFQPGL